MAAPQTDRGERFFRLPPPPADCRRTIFRAELGAAVLDFCAGGRRRLTEGATERGGVGPPAVVLSCVAGGGGGGGGPSATPSHRPGGGGAADRPAGEIGDVDDRAGQNHRCSPAHVKWLASHEFKTRSEAH